MMFSQLDGYNRILVSGPQRSGTRVCSKAIAGELCMSRLDELDFGVDDRKRLSVVLQKSTRPLVIQCPGMMHVLQELADMDTCVVVMMRNKDDIRKSMKRINWNWEQHELSKYAAVWHNSVPPNVKDIVDLKYYIWEHRQKDLIPNYQEIEYESLSANALWRPPEERKHFSPHQTY